MAQITIAVTELHLKFQGPELDPISRAIKAKLEKTYPDIPFTVWIWNCELLLINNISFPLPAAAEDCLMRCQRGLRMKPFMFNLEMPPDGTDLRKTPKRPWASSDKKAD